MPRDPRALPLVLSRLEQASSIGRLAVEAAEYLADARLLPSLRSLGSWWDLDPEVLGRAISRCDPAQRQRELEAQGLFLSRLEAVLADLHQNCGAALQCDRLDNGVVLVISRNKHEIARWDMANLLGAFASDLDGAIRTVISALDRAPRQRP